MGIEDELNEHLQALPRDQTANSPGHLRSAASNGGARARAVNVAIGGLVTVAALLTGCGASDDKAFLEDVRGHAPLYDSYSDSSLVALAHHICKDRRAGVTYGKIRSAMIRSDDTPDFTVQTAFLLAQSISHYCPEMAP